MEGRGSTGVVPKGRHASAAAEKKKKNMNHSTSSPWPTDDWMEEEAEVPRTKRMLKKAEESRAIATDSLDQLHHQGEQLDRAEVAMARMENDLGTADWLLRGMRSYTGMLANYFAPPPPPPPPVTKTETKRRPVQKRIPKGINVRSDVVIEEDEEWILMSSGNRSEAAVAQRNKHIEKKTVPKEEWEQQREMDKDLDQIYDVVSDLKGLSVEAGKEVRRQNEQLDRVNSGMQDLDERVNATNKKVKKYLKGK